MEYNFAHAILEGRSFEELQPTEVLDRSSALLRGWMRGDHSMERPKLYDHYALLLVALIEQLSRLERRLDHLEHGGAGQGER